MRVDDVDENEARTIRCPFCGAQSRQPCRTATIRRVAMESALKRSHRKRRQAWLDRRKHRNGEEVV